jgi:ABC-2 type transport system permease protein
MTPLVAWNPKMKNLIVLFWQYFGQYAKTRLAYKTDFFVACFSSILATVAGYGFVLVLFTRIPNLKGWSFEEVLFVYGFSLIPMGLFNIVSLNLYEFGDIYIVDGKFDRVLLRPVHSLFQILFETFRLESLQEVVTGLLAVGYCSIKLDIPWNVENMLLFPVLILCGAVIYVFVFVMISSVNFWFEDRIGIAPPIYNMIAFGRYPITIYNVFIQFILSWIIPFAFASFYPTVRFLGRKEFMNHFYLIPIVTGAVVVLGLLVWQRGVREYKSTGS